VAQRRHPKALLLLALVSACLSGSLVHAQSTASDESADQHAKADLDALVMRVMKEFEVPGLCVAIVKDDRVLVSQGYGVREMGGDTPVDDKTLFAIASNTKAFTAVALGMLVDRGKLKWGDSVVDHLPGFRMSDRYVTSELTVLDLLVHRSGLGLGAGDLLFWPPTTHSRKELVRRLRHVPLATSFRAHYAYDNVLYPVAGELIEAVSGQSWEDFVQAEILDRVGMNHSVVSSSDLAKATNVAAPHARIDGDVQVVQSFYIDNANPAGGIGSCAADMSKWHRVLLSGGKLPDGSRLYSAQTAKRLWTLVTPIPIGDYHKKLAESKPNFLGYALGFSVRDYRGTKLVSHTGGLPGYLSISSLLPDQNLGVVVLTNQESSAAFRSITYSVLDHYLNADTDWIDAFKTSASARQASSQEADDQTHQARSESKSPSLPLQQYAGTYTDRWYGDVIIKHVEHLLTIQFAHTPVLAGMLEHWQHDTFVARWNNRELRADSFVTFDLNPDGSIDRVRMKAVSAATDFSFDFHDLLLKPK
jgi:CubicO group peptidase (beta-lactamase class C family)